MKTLLFTLSAIVIAATATVKSQTPTPPARNAVEVLRAIRDQNLKLLERQAASLKKLEELEATAKVVKNLAARS